MGGDTPRLWGGATGPDYEPPRPGALDEDELREAARAAAEILEQHAPDPRRPRSRWEQRLVDGELKYVEVERLDPPAGEGD